MTTDLASPQQRSVQPSRGRRQRPFERTVVSCVDEWLELKEREDARPATIVNYRRHLESFRGWLAGEGIAIAGQISPETVRAYGLLMVEIEKAGERMASTVNNHINPVRQFLRWLAAEGAVFDRTPEGDLWLTETRINAWLGDVSDNSRPTRKERALSAAEVRALISVITNPRDRALFTLLAGSGLRVSECCALRAGDIELRGDGAGIVHVLDGKGGNVRAVPVADSVVATLSAWTVSSGLRLGDASDTRTLWPGDKHPDRPITRIRVYQLLEGYAKQAGLPRKISPHNLRHTFGTEFYRSRRDPVAVADALGHSGLDYVQTYVKGVENQEAEPFKPNW